MRKVCQHNAVLPKGLRCDHGYLQIRMIHKGEFYFRNFGAHTKESQTIAEIHLSDKRKEILLGRFNLHPELKSYPFDKVAKEIYLPRWSQETRPDGQPKHTKASTLTCTYNVERLCEYFKKRSFETIKGKDVEEWRTELVKKGISCTTVDRYQNVLQSIYSKISDWIKTEKIRAFKTPEFNPCDGVEKSQTKVRMRILTDYELKKLRMAFVQLNDQDGWEICKLALKTVLSEKDLRKLQQGSVIDLDRAKTSIHVNLPVTVLVSLNWKNWRNRWTAARKLADLKDVQFRDLRKQGINKLAGQHDLKLISQYAGHAKQATTERHYTITQAEKLRPLADHLDTWVESL